MRSLMFTTKFLLTTIAGCPDCTRCFCAGKCVGENNRSTIDSIVLGKVARGRSSGEIAKNADWQAVGNFELRTQVL